MKNKYIYGAITFVLGGVCYYLTSPKKKSYDISQFLKINIEQQILQQACQKLGILGGPIKLTKEFVQKLHSESINICRDQLIGISIIKRQQRRQYVEYDVQQYFDILINELNVKRKLLLDVIKQIMEYGKQDLLKFEEEYKKILQVEIKLEIDYNLDILRIKCQKAKILDKEELIKYLDTATDYLEQHSPQLYRFLQFTEENVDDKKTGMTLLVIFSDDNVFFPTGVEIEAIEESLNQEESSSCPIIDIPLRQQKDIYERMLKFCKAKDFWSNE